MKFKYFLLSFFFSLIATIHINGQSNLELSTPKYKRVNDAYALWLGQEYTLGFIKNDFPQFELNAIRAEHLFNTSFGKSKEGIKKYILELYGSKNVSELEEKGLNGIKNFYAARSFSELDILNSIAEIENRAKGNIQSPILETLLSFQFADKPQDEMIYGFKKIFRTKGHPKSKNTDWQIRVPLSWKSEEGERPNIIQKFTSDYGSGMQMIMLQVEESSFPIDYIASKEGIDDIFTEEVIKHILPNNITLLSSVKIKIEGNNGIKVEFEAIRERLSVKAKMRTVQFMFMRANKMYTLSCMVLSDKIEYDLTSEINKYMPLFNLVANSIVLNEQYRN